LPRSSLARPRTWSSRPRGDRAGQGLLIAWQGCGADQVFDILCNVSQRENRKQAIAEEIVQKAFPAGGTRR
jgi:hypothetical protein